MKTETNAPRSSAMSAYVGTTTGLLGTSLGALGLVLGVVGCNVKSVPYTTGGVDVGTTTDGGDSSTLHGTVDGLIDADTDQGEIGAPTSLDAVSPPQCARGRVIVLSDYVSTQVALSAMDGTTWSAAFLSTGSTKATGVAFALSGDVVVPSTGTTSGEIVLIDRYGTNVITWADPTTAKVRAQLSVTAEGFQPNPQDYLEVDGEAWVTRRSHNPNETASVAALGSDVLRIDPKIPAILGRIPLPATPLPAGPGQMTRIGDVVWITLQRMSDDFIQQDEGQVVGIDVNLKSLVWTVPLPGLKNCGRPVVSPNGRTAAIACAGQLAMDGSSPIEQSAIVFFDLPIGSGAAPVERGRFAPSATLNAPVQAELAWATDNWLLGKTQTPFHGKASNQLFVLDVTTLAVKVLSEARLDVKGEGKGLVFNDLRCGPYDARCGENVCVLADADRGQLQRYRVTPGGLDPLSPITVDPNSALGPTSISEF